MDETKIMGRLQMMGAISSGISVAGTWLAAAFVMLKVFGVIDWPWVWVVAPFWGGLLLFVLTVVGVVARR